MLRGIRGGGEGGYTVLRGIRGEGGWGGFVTSVSGIIGVAMGPNQEFYKSLGAELTKVSR